MRNREQFIPLIHNYCDRWCERCRFILRCRIGVEEVERLKDKSPDDEVDFENVVDVVADNLKKALELLEKVAKENGIDIHSLKEELEETESVEPEYTPEQKRLKEWSQQYMIIGQKWFAENATLIQAKEDEINQKIQMGIEGEARRANELVESMEVIRWFLFFIAVKMDRAIHGLQSNWLEDDDPIQNDANGSAKVTLDAIERSLAAWEVVREHFSEQIDELIDIFVLLGRLRSGVLDLFPKVSSFIRPGFDEPELYAS